MSRHLEKGMSAELRELLRRAGRVADEEGKALFLVGGPVRDLVLGRPIIDLDLTVEGDGIAFAHLLAERLGGEVKCHQRFGTAVLVLPPRLKLDVASARRESYPRPGALPRVEGAGIREDLFRRDFTINSMAIRLNGSLFGRLVDFFGGRRDLRAGILRVLHEGSFADDPTRLFRGVRFEGRFGFTLEAGTEAGLKEAVAGGCLATVSGERIRQEILLILGEEDPRPALRRLSVLGLLAAVHPRFRVRKREIEATAAPEGAASVGRHEVTRRHSWERLLALMSGLPPEVAGAVAERLALSRAFRRWLADLERARGEALPILSRRDPLRRSELYELLVPYQAPALRVLRARADSKIAAKRLAEYLEVLRGTRCRVTGRDLAALGVPPGPRYRHILGRVLAARLDGEVAGRRDELKLLRELVGAGAAGYRGGKI